MERFKTFIAIVFTCCSFYLNAQNKSAKDSLQLTSYVDKIIVKVNLDSQAESFSYFNQDDDDLKLAANNNLRIDLSVDYEFIGFSFGFAPDFFNTNQDQQQLGESDFTSYEFRFFFGNWTHHIKYKRVKGFYVENTMDFIPDFNAATDTYLQFPDFKSTTWGGSSSYVLNSKFSLRNVVYNTEWQHRSAGSFIPTLSYSLFRISTPLNDLKYYQNNFDVQLTADYYYTWVIQDNWFIAPNISPGIGVRFSKDANSANINTQNNVYWPLILNGGLQVGYSSRKWIFGALINFRSSYYDQDAQSSVINDQVFAKAYLGYRFDAPKWLASSFKKINNLFD